MAKAVIFDFDGTLVDTTPVYLSVYMEVLRRDLNLEPEEHMVRKKFGKRSTEILTEMLREMDVDPRTIDVDYIVTTIREEFVSRLKDILMLPGAEELIKTLKKGGKCRIGLATASRPYSINNILGRFGLDGCFDAVVTADDAVRSKPAPDMFLLAAKRLGVKPGDCIAIEDAVYGVRAAKAAGMKVIAVATGASTREELEAEKPDAVLSSLGEFPVFLLE